MERVIKVVVFHVDLPKEKELNNAVLKSQEISIESGEKKSTWNLRCNLNGNSFNKFFKNICLRKKFKSTL